LVLELVVDDVIYLAGKNLKKIRYTLQSYQKATEVPECAKEPYMGTIRRVTDDVL